MPKINTNISKFENKINQGQGYGFNYSFDLTSGSSAYLVLETNSSEIHAVNRLINIIDLSNSVIEVKIETWSDVTATSLGNDITSRVSNLNLNFDDSIDLQGYDETTTIDEDGDGNPTGANFLPFSKTIKGDRKAVGLSFVENKYILEKNTLTAIKFINNGSGDVTIEYSSNGYQRLLEG